MTESESGYYLDIYQSTPITWRSSFDHKKQVRSRIVKKIGKKSQNGIKNVRDGNKNDALRPGKRTWNKKIMTKLKLISRTEHFSITYTCLEKKPKMKNRFTMAYFIQKIFHCSKFKVKKWFRKIQDYFSTLLWPKPTFRVVVLSVRY